MLKRKLLKVYFIIGSFILAAIAFGSISAGNKIVRVKHKAATHQFDSSGLCTCIPFTVTTELTNAPRIQLNKNAASFVKQYNKKNGLFLDKLRDKKQSYFDIIDSVLQQNEIPAELKYLAFIESGLNLNAFSRSGATGPWALMPAAARQYGLKISKKDERLDYYKSTEAAAKLLTDMYAQYGDWLLVIAAYNSGPAWIDKAIKRSGSRDYWKLQNFLPVETRSHVKRFIAAHYHFEGHGSLVTMTTTETEEHIQAVELFKAQQQIEKTDSVTVVIVK
jgi:membrane-bound lytic murein transglycosylase D